MSFRIKLLSGIVALLVFSVGLFLGLTYFHARDSMFRQIQATALSLATAAVPQVEVELHNQIQNPGDESLPAYEEIESRLRRIRDDARRDDVYISFIYTMRQTPSGWIYVVDAEEEGEDKSGVGDAVEFEAHGEVSPISAALVKGNADAAFTEDEFGVWLSANVPIPNAQGDAVAVLGVDLAAADVQRELGKLLTRSLFAFGITLTAGIALALVLAQKATRPLRILKAGVDSIAGGELSTRVEHDTPDEFGSLATSVNGMAKSIREREMLMDAFARYVSRDIAGRAFDAGKIPLPDGTRQRVTVLFSDIRGFDTWSMESAPEDIVTQLDDYFAKMVEIVFRNRGMLDKSVGDGFMAVFGAPHTDPEQERHAISSMLEMHGAMQKLNRQWQAEGKAKFEIGIGVHSGMAVVGTIGNEKRMDYTAVGTHVNVAADLEAKTERRGTAGLVTAETVAAVRDEFDFEPAGTVPVENTPGDPLEVFTLTGLKSGERDA